MAKKNNTLLYVGAGAVGLYLLLNNAGGSAASSSLLTTGSQASLLPNSTAQNTYPYVLPGAPAIPAAYDDNYYKTWIRPAMVIVNSNLNNPGYRMNDSEAAAYLANYLDLRQALPAWVGHKFSDWGTVTNITDAANRHWKIYGVAEQRTYMPLPWSEMVAFVPAPAKTSSGSGLLGTIVKVATIAAGGILTVTTAGTAAPLIAAGESAALTAESAAFHGPGDVLNDEEINLVVTSAAIIKKMLPFYLQVAPQLVNSIENKLDTIIAKYQN